ncbi:MAG TPA: hypothetical protein DEO98_00865 [Legionellales bacterium]|nr:hypothetical protein [Legionellales bacterium]
MILLFFIQGISVATALTNLYFLFKMWTLHRHTVQLATSNHTLPSYPTISIIVPIHNEEKHLEQAMTSLCQSAYPHFEIIAVNDRSTDNSALILARLQRRFKCLRVLTITQLPAHWLGKTHALQKGLEHAIGDFIIFTDADVIFAPQLLQQAIAYMLEHQLEHLTLPPYLLLQHFFMRWYMPFQLFVMLLAMRPWRVGNENTPHALGIGAFNCVTKRALTEIGFMQHLALNPVDDMGLARLLKKQKIRQGFANPQHLLQLEWYGSLQALARGLEKNIFAFFDYSIVKCGLVLLAYSSLFFLPFILLGSSHTVLVGCSSMTIILILSMLIAIYQQLNVSPWYALLYPLAACINLLIGARAILLGFWRGGINWGGQFRSLTQLKNFYYLNKEKKKL